MISNIINVLNSPNILKDFLPEEQIRLFEIVKEHILKNAEILTQNVPRKKR